MTSRNGSTFLAGRGEIAQQSIGRCYNGNDEVFVRCQSLQQSLRQLVAAGAAGSVIAALRLSEPSRRTGKRSPLSTARVSGRRR